MGEVVATFWALPLHFEIRTTEEETDNVLKTLVYTPLQKTMNMSKKHLF